MSHTDAKTQNEKGMLQDQQHVIIAAADEETHWSAEEETTVGVALSPTRIRGAGQDEGAQTQYC